MPKEKVVLTMNRATADIVSRACEFYARVCMGQFEEMPREIIVWAHNPRAEFQRDEAGAHLRYAKMALFPELPVNASYGVGKNPRIDTAFGVHDTLRYVSAWHDFPEGGITVDFQPPMQYGGEPLPKCEIIQEGAE